jgi:hypothetical protein
MTIFELVKVALDELYVEGLAEYGERLDATVKERLEYLGTAYADLNNPNRPQVNYRDPATRLAYVYAHVTANADYLLQILRELKQRLGGPIFDTRVRVTCLGGGPGSDLIGLLKYLQEKSPEELEGEDDEHEEDEEHEAPEEVERLICYLVDREQAWADTWTELEDKLDVDAELKTNFQPLDVTNPESWKYQKKFLQADLFTILYFASEVQSLNQGGVVTEFWRTVFREAKPGALFIYLDNGHTDFTAPFDELCAEAGLNTLLAKNKATVVASVDERASVLNSYRQKFGRYPRLKSLISYRVLQKPLAE